MLTKIIRTFYCLIWGFLFVVITTMAAHNHLSIDSTRNTSQEMSKTNTQQLEGLATAVTSNVAGLNFANFNQDFTCISVGYQNGYRIYNCDPFGRCYEKSDLSIGIVEMLFCSSLLAIVGTGDNPSMSPRRLKIVNTKRQTTICELTFPGTILSIHMNRERLIVLLEETIYIYDITNMRLLHTVEIPPNPSGLFALSSSSENNYLAYPSPQKVSKATSVIPVDITAINAQHPHSLQTNPNSVPNNTHDTDPNSHLHHHQQNSQSVRNGDVIIFNCKTLQPISVIEAHKTQIAAMAFSFDGLLLATASDKGTIIRVFSVETGVKLYQFRRGTYNTKIYSLAFSPDNMFVIASSATETVHIFRLGEEEANNTIIRSKSGGYFNLGLGNASLDAADKILESARQEELSKMMKIREAKIDSAEGLEGLEVEGDDNDDDAFDDLVADIEHSDSEEEEEEELDVDSDSGDDDEDAGLELVEGNDVLHPLPSDVKKSNTDSSSGAISIFSNVSVSNSKIEPVVDNTRISVARMLRRTSQSLGRKAAEKMGTYLPPKFSSILEPNRHFASLKVPTSKDTTTVVGIGELVADELLPPSMLLNDETSSLSSSGSKSSKRKGRRKLVHVMVITADGFFYNYGLDVERGGDCVLLNQHSLME